MLVVDIFIDCLKLIVCDIYCHAYVCYFACSMLACNSVRLSLKSVKGNLLTSLSKCAKPTFCYMRIIRRQYILTPLSPPHLEGGGMMYSSSDGDPAHGDPSYIPPPLSDCLCHVSFRRYSPLIPKIVGKLKKCIKFIGPYFYDGQLQIFMADC